jgi:hypothetical protein
MNDTGIDHEALQAKMGLLGGVIQNSAMLGPIMLGLRLGLYEALAAAPGWTSEQLASTVGLNERWVREWLRQQACAAIVDYASDGRGKGRFSLSAESSALLADRDGPRWMGGIFYALPPLLGNLRRLEESFRTGRGMTWDDRGDEASEATEQSFRTWHQHQLVPAALLALEGVVEKLHAGAPLRTSVAAQELRWWRWRSRFRRASSTAMRSRTSRWSGPQSTLAGPGSRTPSSTTP